MIGCLGLFPLMDCELLRRWRGKAPFFPIYSFSSFTAVFPLVPQCHLKGQVKDWPWDLKDPFREVWTGLHSFKSMNSFPMDGPQSFSDAPAVLVLPVTRSFLEAGLCPLSHLRSSLYHHPPNPTRGWLQCLTHAGGPVNDCKMNSITFQTRLKKKKKKFIKREFWVNSRSIVILKMQKDNENLFWCLLVKLTLILIFISPPFI